MRTRRVLLDDAAKSDLRNVHRWITLHGVPKIASAYIRRIQKFARTLNTASERGHARDDIELGLRMVPFQSVILAVYVEDNALLIARVFHGSQDWERELRREAWEEHHDKADD